MLLLAQLVAPPLQPGPVRLPNPTTEQKVAPQAKPFFEQPESDNPSPEIPENAPNTDLTSSSWSPKVIGDKFFSDKQLSIILETCRQKKVADTLNKCAAKLTAELISRGYINSRVYISKEPEPGALEVVLGRISEVKVTSTDSTLEQKLKRS